MPRDSSAGYKYNPRRRYTLISVFNSCCKSPLLPPPLSFSHNVTILFVIFRAMNIHFQYPLVTAFSVVKLQKIIAEVLMTPHVMQIFLPMSLASRLICAFFYIRGNDCSLLLQTFSKTYILCHLLSSARCTSRAIF